MVYIINIKSAKVKSYLQKFILLVIYGLPGLTKIINSLVIKNVYKLDYLGVYANDLNIAMIICSLPFGLTALLLNRIPNIQNDLKPDFLYRILVMTLTMVLALLPIVYVLFKFNIVINLLAFSIFILGYSIYQIFRQLWISEKNYFKCLLLDVFLGLFVPLLIFLLHNKLNGFSIHTIIVAFVGIGLLVFNILNMNRNKLNKDEFFSGIRFGFSNLSSSILSLLSVPLTFQLLGQSYAGVLGIINPIINITLLIPRSISVEYTVNISALRNKFSEQYVIFKRFLTQNSIFLLLCALIIVIVWHTYKTINPESDIFLEYSFIIVLLVLTNIISSQISLPLYSLLTAWDDSKVSLKSNLIPLGIFGLSLLIIRNQYLQITYLNQYISLYIILIFVNSLRAVVLFVYIQKKCIHGIKKV